MGRGFEERFFHGRLQTANRYIKRCSTSLIIKEIVIKTTGKHQLTPVRMAVIKKTRDIQETTSVARRKGNFCALLVRM